MLSCARPRPAQFLGLILRTLFFFCLAGNQQGECSCVARDVRGLEVILRVRGLVRHHAVIQKVSQRSRFVFGLVIFFFCVCSPHPCPLSPLLFRPHPPLPLPRGRKGAPRRCCR